MVLTIRRKSDTDRAKPNYPARYEITARLRSNGLSTRKTTLYENALSSRRRRATNARSDNHERKRREDRRKLVKTRCCG